MTFGRCGIAEFGKLPNDNHLRLKRDISQLLSLRENFCGCARTEIGPTGCLEQLVLSDLKRKQ